MKILVVLGLSLLLAGCPWDKPQSVCDNFIGFEKSICQVNESYLTALRTANASYKAGDINSDTHKEIIEVLIDVDSMLDKAEILLGKGKDPTEYILIAQDLLRSL